MEGRERRWMDEEGRGKGEEEKRQGEKGQASREDKEKCSGMKEKIIIGK